MFTLAPRSSAISGTVISSSWASTRTSRLSSSSSASSASRRRTASDCSASALGAGAFDGQRALALLRMGHARRVLAPVATSMIRDHAREDSHQPATDRRLAVVLREPPVEDHERVLHDVVSGRLGHAQAPRRAPHEVELLRRRSRRTPGAARRRDRGSEREHRPRHEPALAAAIALRDRAPRRGEGVPRSCSLPRIGRGRHVRAQKRTSGPANVRRATAPGWWTVPAALITNDCRDMGTSAPMPTRTEIGPDHRDATREEGLGPPRHRVGVRDLRGAEAGRPDARDLDPQTRRHLDRMGQRPAAARSGREQRERRAARRRRLDRAVLRAEEVRVHLDGEIANEHDAEREPAADRRARKEAGIARELRANEEARRTGRRDARAPRSDGRATRATTRTRRMTQPSVVVAGAVDAGGRGRCRGVARRRCRRGRDGGARPPPRARAPRRARRSSRSPPRPTRRAHRTCSPRARARRATTPSRSRGPRR